MNRLILTCDVAAAVLFGNDDHNMSDMSDIGWNTYFRSTFIFDPIHCNSTPYYLDSGLEKMLYLDTR